MSQKKYYDKNKEKFNEASKDYRTKNKDKIKELHKQYYQDNADKLKEQAEKNRTILKEKVLSGQLKKPSIKEKEGRLNVASGLFIVLFLATIGNNMRKVFL